ncbi:MAG: FAD:protein FMN transferase, partial [Bacteroidales bacterium]|nr:FAD:protein FMN transferase [Bacteroidales bacterium]
VAPLVEVWGFGLSQRDAVTDIIIDSILQFVGYEKVSLKHNRLVKEDNRLTINFNAIAQGYAVDYIGTYLRSKGITSFLIDVGGEVLASGTKPNDIPWRIAIEKPSDDLPAARDLSDSYVQKYAQVIINISNRAVATSGDYRTFYLNEEGIKVSHTINPKTGKPVDHSLLSATVITDNCAKADAWATAFMVLGVDSAKKLLKTNDELEGFLIYSDNNGHTVTYATENIKRQLEEITREK